MRIASNAAGKSSGDTETLAGMRSDRIIELQDVQELTNFFERRVSAYQVGVTGDVVFAEEF